MPKGKVVEHVQAPKAKVVQDDPQYAPFLAGVAQHFAATAERAPALFSVDTTGLWEAYLDAFPTSERQTYACSACRAFVQRFGGLVTIDDDGERVSAIWNPASVHDAFSVVAERLRDAVARRPVDAVFVAAAGTLGTPQTGAWTHLAAALPAGPAHRDRLRTPAQVAAAIRENVSTVTRALDEFPQAVVDDALRVLGADALSRAEKFIGPVRWLSDLHVRRAATKDERRRAAFVWRAVATAPEGYSHPRASVVGPLLEGIVAGKSFETLRAEFNAMLHPLRYQRPQAAPSAGNIAEAERIVAQLGIARSLERRFARIEDCRPSWTPKANNEESVSAGGVFAHLAAKGGSSNDRTLTLPAQTMTWEKFTRAALPDAERIEFDVPRHGNFSAFLTAAHADAPPIIRWDREDARNAVTSYIYHHGSPCDRWRLTPGWRTVMAIVPRPNLWGDHPQPQHGEGVTFVLAGAVDTLDSGLALFPETLRDDLRAIRSTIEAFSERGTISGREEASACGYAIGKEHCGVRFRVLSRGHWTVYHIDRWD